MTDPRGREITFEFQYHDYKETNGVKHPMRINVKMENKVDMVMELSDLKTQAKLEPSLFAAPE